MKKTLFILPLVVMLTSCGGSAPSASDSTQGSSAPVSEQNTPSSTLPEEKDYTLCTFHYNDGRAGDDTYKTVVVMKDKDLLRPDEPVVVDKIFTGWFRDKNATKEFQGFNDILVQDLDLYAGWQDYESASDILKLQKVYSLMDTLSGSVTHTSVEMSSTTYYAMTGSFFPSGANIEYNRYSDLTVADYHDPDKEIDDASSLFATEQFQYDNDLFYDLYHDIEGKGANDSKKTALFSNKKLEGFLSIDFANLYMRPVKNLIDCLSDGESGLEEYEFDCNYTKVNTDSGQYSFNLNYVTVNFSESMGNVEEDFYYEFGITFLNGTIASCKRVATYVMGIEGDVITIDNTTEFAHFTQGKEFPRFTGTYLEPTDFN